MLADPTVVEKVEDGSEVTRADIDKSVTCIPSGDW